jgi:hypothetical protein
MTDEIKERLEKGCGKLFYDEKHNEYNCGLFDLALCPKCKLRLEQHKQSTEAERKRLRNWLVTLQKESIKLPDKTRIDAIAYNAWLLDKIFDKEKELNEAVKE